MSRLQHGCLTCVLAPSRRELLSVAGGSLRVLLSIAILDPWGYRISTGRSRQSRDITPLTMRRNSCSGVSTALYDLCTALGDVHGKP